MTKKHVQNSNYFLNPNLKNQIAKKQNAKLNRETLKNVSKSTRKIQLAIQIVDVNWEKRRLVAQTRLVKPSPDTRKLNCYSIIALFYRLSSTEFSSWTKPKSNPVRVWIRVDLESRLIKRLITIRNCFKCGILGICKFGRIKTEF